MTPWGSVNNYYLRKLKKWFEWVFVVQLASFLTFCVGYLANFHRVISLVDVESYF